MMTLDDFFWEKIQRDVGNVLPHIKNILKLEGLAANDALAMLTREDISAMELQMRFRIARVRREILASPSKSMEDFYGDYAEQPELFFFTAGDIRVLQTLAAAVSKNGLKKYIPAENPTGETSKQQCNAVNQGKEQTELIGRLKQHYSNCTLGCEELEDITTFLNSITMKFEGASGGKTVAFISCPACCHGNKRKELKVVKEALRSWPLFNILRHFNSHFRIPDITPKRKQNREHGSAHQSKRYRHETTTTDSATVELATIEPATIEPRIKRATVAPEKTEEIERIVNGYSDIEFDDEPAIESLSETGSEIENENCSNNSNDKSSNDSVLFREISSMHNTINGSNPHARRYTDVEKDIMAFEYLTAGNSYYDYTSTNMATMSKKTIHRHMRKYTLDIFEGCLDIAGLKKYLVDNDFPLEVALCEDATRITAATEYDYLTDSIRGLVAPFDSNGLPKQNMFKASTPQKMMDDLKSYAFGNYAYIQLALPLSPEAAPYVLYHACSDNKFGYRDVLNRWKHTEDLLRQEGIKVVAYASDGDPRLLKAMRLRSGLDKEPTPSPWGWWFRVDQVDGIPVNIQDIIHTINKFRNKLVRDDLKIGNYTITTKHLKELVKKHSKDNHLLCLSDVEIKDKMKFGSTLKWINPKTISYLKSNIPESAGTVLFLDLMRLMYRALVEDDIPPLERIHDLWTANFIVRAWRNWLKSHYNNVKLCVSTNAYNCLELNAHSLIIFMQNCQNRNASEQFDVSYLSSQPCEKLFRQLRSMGTTQQTVINFTAKELTEKLKRIYTKMRIMHNRKEDINFPFITRLQNKRREAHILPSDESIIQAVEKAQETAREALLQIGIKDEDINTVL